MKFAAKKAKFFKFKDLDRNTPLLLDAIYQGGPKGNISDDPLTKLIPGCPNQGGFRIIGGRDLSRCSGVILTSSGAEPDWPDRLDSEAGQFIYYGDNRTPGHGLLDTPKGGNRLLEQIFAAADSGDGRKKIPPILIFTKNGIGRDISFRGLAVPELSEDGGLIAIWRQTAGRRFQNYKAFFSIIDCDEVSRRWLESFGDHPSENRIQLAPLQWARWVEKGTAKILKAPKTVKVRTKTEQLPEDSDRASWAILDALRTSIKTSYEFEFIAAEIFKLIEPRIFEVEITRERVDGGRDALGRLRLGGHDTDSDGISIEFSLEAKNYQASTGVGVKETSRLISRLRHRQFGVLITTSYVSLQAYKELRQDEHPIIIISGKDIASILRANGLSKKELVERWVAYILAKEPPRSAQN